MIGWKKPLLFIGGTVFGSAGLKLLTSRDAKRVYAHSIAAVLRMKDSVVDTVTRVQENVDDILMEAKEINAERLYDEEFEEFCEEDDLDEVELEPQV